MEIRKSKDGKAATAAGSPKETRSQGGAGTASAAELVGIAIAVGAVFLMERILVKRE